MARERGGTPFRQIFWSRNGAPANTVGHRWNANTEVYFLAQIVPRTWDWASKIYNKFSRGHTPAPPQWEGATPCCTHPQHGYTPCMGALPSCWDLGLGNRSPQIKIYHYTPGQHQFLMSSSIDSPHSPSITPLLFNSWLKTYLFWKPSPGLTRVQRCGLLLQT